MTRKRGCFEYGLGGAALVLVVAMGVFSLASGISHRRLERVTSTLKQPEMLQRYTEVVAREQAQSSASETHAVPSVPAEESASLDKLARWDQLLKRWERFNANKGEGSWHGVRVLLGVEEGAYDVTDGGKTPLQLSPAEWVKVEVCLDREQKLINEILNTAQLGGPVYPIDLTKWPPEDLPHHGILRQMCSFLVWDAAVKTRAGDLDGAVASLTGCARLGDALCEEPLIWSQFTGEVSIVRSLSWFLREGFEPGQVPPEILRPLLHELLLAKRRDTFADAMRAEAFIRLRQLATSRSGKDKARGIRDMNGDTSGAERSPVGRAMLRMYVGPLGKPWFDRDLVVFAEAAERISKAAEGPYYRAEPLLTSLREEQLSESISHPLAPFLLGGYVETLQLQAQLEAAADLTRIGLLVEAYRTQLGQYPKTLDEIANNLRGVVPLDPFSGQPYHYSVGKESFLLYSVGPNQRDDNGHSHWREGDIVWRGDH